jgi:hypothetical protein
MAWLFVHPAGALLLRYKGGHWSAELHGRRFGRWTRPADGARALHAGLTGDPAWDGRDDRMAVPPELAAWRHTLDAWEDAPPVPPGDQRTRR